eukprot:jgi/Ulvmu1/6122/UM027_0100.1
MTIVIDLGSRSTEFVEWAVEAAVNLVDWMGPNDRAGIVAFSSQAPEVQQLTLATPSGRETLRSSLRLLCPPASSHTPPASPPPTAPIPPTVLSSALTIALGQQQAGHSAAGGSSTSHLSSAGPVSDSSPLIAAAYPSSHSSTIEPSSHSSTSPRFNLTGPLHRVSDDGTSDSVSSSSSMHALRAGTASPPPICRSSPLLRHSPPHGASDPLSPPPFSHTAFLHTVPENNGGSDDEFEDENEEECRGRGESGMLRCAAGTPAIHNTAVFLLTPRRLKPCIDRSDDPVVQLRRFGACAAPVYHFVPVSNGKRSRQSDPTPVALAVNTLRGGADPTTVHGTEHSFSRLPADVYNPADPTLDAFDPAASPRPLSMSPFLPIPVYAFGVGGAYDPEPLSNIAAATGGSFQHIPQPRDLPPALAAACGAASAAFAADVEVRVTPLCGSRVSVMHTGYPVWVEGPDVVVHIPEIAARMQKDLLLTLSLPPCTTEELAAPCVKHLAGVATVSYTRARTGKLACRKSCIVLPRIEVVGSARGFGTPDPAAVTEHMRLVAAQACADAVRLCCSGSYTSAQQKLVKLRSGIKQLLEVCKAAHPRCSDSKRCMHALAVLGHVISDLTSAASAAASLPAFEGGGHAALRAIERSHACQLPQAPASVRRCEAAMWPKGCLLRIKDRSSGKQAKSEAEDHSVRDIEAPRKRPQDLRCGAARAADASASLEAGKGGDAGGPGPAAAPPACRSRGPSRSSTGAAGRVNSMLRRVCKRVRSSRARDAQTNAAPVAASAPVVASAPAKDSPASLAAPALSGAASAKPRAAHGEAKKADSQQVIAVRVSAYTCQAQMALVAAAVRRAEAC